MYGAVMLSRCPVVRHQADDMCTFSVPWLERVKRSLEFVELQGVSRGRPVPRQEASSNGDNGFYRKGQVAG